MDAQISGEQNRGGRWIRFGAVGAVVVLLAAAAFLLKAPASGNARPLFPDDVMKVWQTAKPQVRQATAESLVDTWQKDGRFGPQTLATVRDAAGKARLVDELVAGLDAASARNRKEYVSPSESITRVAESIASKKGWDK